MRLQLGTLFHRYLRKERGKLFSSALLRRLQGSLLLSRLASSCPVFPQI